MDEGAGARPRLDSLTGLRAFAAFAVYALHVRLPMSGGGFAGVSFFFILSGFVLAWSARPGGTASWFWWRRAARILPAYYVTWAVPLLALTALGPVPPWGNSVPGWVLLQSWFPSKDIHFAINGVSWSLSCEAFFYACFPAIFPLLTRLGSRGLAVLATAAAAVVIGLPCIVHSGDPNFFWTYVFPPARLPEFILGMALATLVARGHRAPALKLWWTAPLALMACLGANYVPAWAATVALTALPFAALIVAAAQADLTSARSLFSVPVIVTLGVWSYAFYLVHEIAIKALNMVGVEAGLPLAALTLVLGVIGAAMIYRLVEHPVEARIRAAFPGRKVTREAVASR